jgi:hypothetical protein
LPVRPASPALFLVGIGTFMEADGGNRRRPKCKVGISVPTSTLEKMKQHMNAEKQKGELSHVDPLSDIILAKPQVPSPYTVVNPLKIAASFHFYRNTYTEEFLGRFKSCFSGSHWHNFHQFQDTLRRVVDEDMIYPGDKIAFFWFDDGDMFITKNDEVRGRIFKEDINKRLLQVLVDDEKTIVKELGDSLHENVNTTRPW